MANFSNITSGPTLQTANLPLGLLIQIAFSNGIRNQISTDYRDFEHIKRAKVANSLARELRFMFQTSLGYAAIQYADPGEGSRAFPTSDAVSLQEYAAVLKEIDATIEVDYGTFDRARKNPEKYGEPVQIEVESKLSAAKRQMAKDLYGDGSGVIGTVGAASALSSGLTTITLSSSSSAWGHVGFFEYGDLLIARETDGTPSASAYNAGAKENTVFRVVNKNRDTNQVVLQYVSGATAAEPTAGEVLYRNDKRSGDQSTAIWPNLTAASPEYGTISRVMAGLASLASWDGRKVHGITMSGVTAATQYDAGGNPLDVKHIQKLMSAVKLAVGQDRYRWKMLTMAPESHSTLIESRETDRRFQTIDDNKRGVKFFAYVHGNDVLECNESEFCPQNRIYCLPETKAGEKVLEFHGSDFETVKGQDMTDFHLKVDGGYRNSMVSYLNAKGVLICKHPASIGVIHNFTNS